MKQRSSLVGAGLTLACVILVAGCGEMQPQSTQAAATEPVVLDARPPARARSRHALNAPAEARRLTSAINARQAAAMAELDR